MGPDRCRSAASNLVCYNLTPAMGKFIVDVIFASDNKTKRLRISFISYLNQTRDSVMRNKIVSNVEKIRGKRDEGKKCVEAFQALFGIAFSCPDRKAFINNFPFGPRRPSETLLGLYQISSLTLPHFESHFLELKFNIFSHQKAESKLQYFSIGKVLTHDKGRSMSTNNLIRVKITSRMLFSLPTPQFSCSTAHECVVCKNAARRSLDTFR